jgi:hypothetical protein
VPEHLSGASGAGRAVLLAAMLAVLFLAALAWLRGSIDSDAERERYELLSRTCWEGAGGYPVQSFDGGWYCQLP